MRRPPTPEKMERGVKKAVRMIGFAVKDKSGKYKDASPGEKERIEKRVGKWMKKFGHKFEKRVRPKTMKKMRDAYRARQKGKQVQTVSTKKLAARMKRIGKSGLGKPLRVNITKGKSAQAAVMGKRKAIRKHLTTR